MVVEIRIRNNVFKYEKKELFEAVVKYCFGDNLSSLVQLLAIRLAQLDDELFLEDNPTIRISYLEE